MKKLVGIVLIISTFLFQWQILGQDSSIKEEIERLIKELGNDKWKIREKATEALVNIGEKAVPYLNEALSSSDLEVKVRAERILKRINEGNPYVPKSRDRYRRSGRLPEGDTVTTSYLSEGKKVYTFRNPNTVTKLIVDRLGRFTGVHEITAGEEKFTFTNLDEFENKYPDVYKKYESYLRQLYQWLNVEYRYNRYENFGNERQRNEVELLVKNREKIQYETYRRLIQAYASRYKGEQLARFLESLFHIQNSELKIEILTTIKGINTPSAMKLLNRAKMDPDTKVSQMASSILESMSTDDRDDTTPK